MHRIYSEFEQQDCGGDALMLALEDAFDAEFPDRMLKRSVFESVAGITAALGELQAQAA